jgi:hypothetical protein
MFDDDVSWTESFWKWAVNQPHYGDCHKAEVVIPMTCSACVVEEVRERMAFARKIMCALSPSSPPVTTEGE